MKAKFKSNKSFDDTKDTSQRAPKPDELIDVLKFPPNDWVQMRFVGPVVAQGKHWLKGTTKAGKEISFPKDCLAFDPQTEDHDSTKECPYCDIDSEKVRFSKSYYGNAIIRQLQEDEPSKKVKPSASEEETGFKKKNSKAWTPVRGVYLTSTLARELKKLGALNRHKDKKTGETKAFPLSHSRYGCDVSILHDPDSKTPTNAYSVQKGDKSPLTEEENEYLMWNIEELSHVEKLADAKKEVERWAKQNGEDGGSSKKGKKKIDLEDEDEMEDDEDDEDLDTKKKPKGKAKPAAKGKKKPADDEDDDFADEDEEVEDEEEEEEEDEAPKKGKKPVKKKADLNDDDDLDDEEEEDEDEKPVKKGAKKPTKLAAKGKKKPSDDEEEDDDLDEDEEEEDEEDDDPPPKKGAKKPVKKPVKKPAKKSRDEEDEEDEEEEEDDEEDDDPPPKKGAKKPVKAPAKKKKPADDEDEEEEDDDDLDEDEDEEEDDDPPPKKKVVKKAPAKKAAKKKKPADDEDEEDEDD